MAIATIERPLSVPDQRKAGIELQPIHPDEVLYSGMRLREWDITHVLTAMDLRIRALRFGKDYGVQVSELNLVQTKDRFDEIVKRYNLTYSDKRLIT